MTSITAKTLCPACQRAVEKLYRTAYRPPDGAESVEFLCYACRYNVFPPVSPHFNRVQEWRSAHGLSIRQLSEADAAAAKADRAERQAQAGEGPAPDWQKLRDEGLIKDALRDQATGQIAKRIECLYGHVVSTPIVVQFPEVLGGKRKVAWFCNEAEADKWFAEAARWKLGARYPVTDEKGKLKAWLLPSGKRIELEAEPEFCPKCDHLLDVCICEEKLEGLAAGKQAEDEDYALRRHEDEAMDDEDKEAGE